MTELILELQKIYCTLLSKDYSKDPDNHWYIGKLDKYSYGTKKEAVYIVKHDGFIYEEVYEEFKTYEKAEAALINYLCDAIDFEIEAWGMINEDDSVCKELLDHKQLLLEQVRNNEFKSLYGDSV